MLSFVGRPQVIKRIADPKRGKVTLKRIHLLGIDPSIMDVILKRLSNHAKRQMPKRKDLAQPSHSRVIYGVCSEGIFIRRLDVQFGQSWSCFFADDGRQGSIQVEGGMPNDFVHYLKDAEFIASRIQRYEEGQEISRLASMGPEVFQHRRSN